MRSLFSGASAALLVLCAAQAGEAAAQAAPAPDLESLARNLDDAERSFQYAAAAIAAGDVRGAIAALERVLQINPDLANIKLELGLLYLRVGQPDLARAYIEAAIASPSAPEEIRRRAQAAIREADLRLRRTSIRGNLSVGAQYESNPNAAPDAIRAVIFGGVPVDISGSALSVRRDADWSAVVSGGVDLRYGLDNQNGDEIAVDLQAFQSLYRDATDLNATFLGVRVGPRLYRRGAPDPKQTIRPYVLLRYLALDGEGYYASSGVGVTYEQRLSLEQTLFAQVDYERRNFDSNAERPFTANQSGDYVNASLGGSWRLGPRTEVSGELFGEHADTRAAFESRNRWGARLGLARAIAPPTGGESWLARLSAGYRRSDYDRPDPFVDPFTTRTEDQAFAEASLSVPISDRTAVDLRLQQTWNRSNLPNYEYDNTLAGLSLNIRF